MKEQTLEDLIAQLHETEMRVLAAREGYIDALYEQASERVKRIAPLMGLEETELVELCVQTVRNRRDMTWIDLLDILDEFYVNKRRMGREKAGEDRRGAPYSWEEKILNLLEMASLVGTYLEVEIEDPGSDGHKETRRALDNEYEAFCDWRCVDPYIVDEIKQLLAGKERREQ